MKAKVSSISAIICLITLVFFCILACDNGSVSDSASSKTSGLTKVCLTIEEKTSGIIQKSISTNTAWDSYTFQYSANPKWTDANVQGKTGWTTIEYFEGISLGFFAPGQWTFGVRIIDENDNDNVIYQGSSDVSIVNSSVDFNLNVLVDNKGSVVISITAPTVQNDGLSISYSGTDSGSVSVQPTRENGITTFRYEFSDQSALDAGSYVFTLKHTVNSIADDSGAALAITLRPGEEVNITGHLENGEWQLSYITVKIYSITINTEYEGISNCTVKANTASAAAGERVSFYVNPFQGTEKVGVSYTWEDNPNPPVNLEPSNGLYSFIMPEGDVTINAFYRGSGGDINIGFFRAFFQILYSSNPTAISFGRSPNPPAHSGFFEIKDVLLWCEEDNEHHKRIWWYNEPHAFKFKPGSLDELFKDCTSFKTIDLSGIDTSAVDNMSGMFANCANLQNITFDEKENGKFKHFNTSNVEDMSSMFENCVKLESLNLASIDTHKVESMSRMFKGCEVLTEIVLDSEKVTDEEDPRFGKFLNFNTSNVTDMSYMFCGRKVEAPNVKPTAMSLTTLDVSGLDTSSVEDMSYMFYMCWQLSTLDVSGFKTSNVTNMSNMFACYNNGDTLYPGSLTALNMSGWDFSNVTTVAKMFDRQELLDEFLRFPGETQEEKEAGIVTNFASLTNMNYMFSQCRSLRPTKLGSIVGTWKFPAGAYENNGLFGKFRNTSTDPNFIIRDTMLAGQTYGNFGVRQKYTTADGKNLYIGGAKDTNNSKNCELTINKGSYQEQ